MRILLILSLLVILPIYIYAQDYNGAFDEYFFGRESSTRAEAMGKTYASIDGDLTTFYYNPAGSATINGVELSGSYAAPYYLLEEVKYSFVALGYQFSKYLTVGMGHKGLYYGEVSWEEEDGNYSSLMMSNSTLTLNLSSEPLKGLLVGLNANLLNNSFIDDNYSFYLDLGLIKKFVLKSNNKELHNLNLGLSIANLTNSRFNIDIDNSEDIIRLPITSKIGVSYNYIQKQRWLIDGLNRFEFLLQSDYQHVLNSNFYRVMSVGAEYLFLELLSFRIGYYYEKVDDLGNSEANVDEIHSFPFGFGLNIPLNKLSNIPMEFKVDYTSCPQPSYSKTVTEFDNFTSIRFSAKWYINHNSE